MASSGDPGATPDTDPRVAKLLGLINAAWIPQVLHAAAALGLPDHLSRGPRTSGELAQTTGAHAPSLHRLLRALVTLEVVAEREDGRFELTALGALLRNDLADSVRSWAILVGRYQWPLWGELVECVRTGESARMLLAGTEGFQHLERDPEAAAIFNQAMVETTRLIAPRLARAVDFSGVRTIVDVGGGYGELLATLLAAHPALRGVLYDLPHAVEHARRHLARNGLSARCDVVAGDFFEHVPPGADAYLLKSILHDWDDGRCRTILGNIRAAMAEGARVLVVDRIMPERLEASEAHRALARLDLHMLVAHAAGERTDAQLRELLASASLRVERVLGLGRGFGVVVARAG